MLESVFVWTIVLYNRW